MKRFLCAAFFIALVALLAACGVLNQANSASEVTATPTNSTSRTQQRSESETVTVNETVAKVDVVTAQSSQVPASTVAPATPESTPATGDFPVVYLAGVIGLILICSAGLLMLRKI